MPRRTAVPARLSFQEPTTFVVHASGHVTLLELKRILDEMLAHPRFGRGVRVLVDARLIGDPPCSEDLRTIARELKPLVDRGIGPMAVVTARPVVYGIARMFSVFAEAMHAHVSPFQSLEDARKWLETQPSAAA
jgi:hypothetical protein